MSPTSVTFASQVQRAPRKPSHQPLGKPKGRDDALHEPPLPHPSSSIPHLREAISSLEIQVARLVKQKEQLQRRLERAVRSQSPVLRLPSELLSSIFVLGVLEMDDDDPIMVATLMLVCRYWADVAVNTPLLWSKIAVSPHDSLAKAKRKLQRSKSCPLDVSINFEPRLDYPNSVMEQVIHAMDIIRPAIWRIRSLSLTVPNRPQAHAALTRCREEAPILETLSIRVYNAMQDDQFSHPPLPLFNGCTPRLKSCSLTSFNFGWDLQLVSRLRVLNLEGYFNMYTPSVSTLLDILLACPELEHLGLRNIPDVDSWPCPPSEGSTSVSLTKPIHLPHLKSVYLYYVGAQSARELMRHITFPRLEVLEVAYLENITPIIQMLYAQALTQLPLRRLRIETCLFNELKFLNLLKRLSSLSTLVLVDIEDVSSCLLKGLSSSQPWVCPRLENITLDGCTSLDWDSLRTFVESRLPRNTQTYQRPQDPRAFVSALTSASTAAARQTTSRHYGLQLSSVASLNPHRLQYIDVTRCTQISKEMVQWLKMFVPHVVCEAVKGVWG